MRQRKNQLRLETELAKAEAEELAYVNADSEMTANALREVGSDKEHVSAPQSQSIPKEEKPNGEDATVVEPKPDAPKETGRGPSHDPSAKEHQFNQPRRVPSPMAETPMTSQRLCLEAETSGWQNKGPQYPSFDAVTNSAPQPPPALPTSSDVQFLLQQQQEAIMALTLPQPDVSVFTGDPVEYCDFIRAFENLIERKTSVLAQDYTISLSTRAVRFKILCEAVWLCWNIRATWKQGSC